MGEPVNWEGFLATFKHFREGRVRIAYIQAYICI